MSPASKHDGPARRSNHVTMPVAYAAVGASNAPDLLRFPPEDSTPFEEALKLGSGQERFLIASSLLMTWGAQRGAGFEVVDIVPGDGGQYSGVSFDPSGAPAPAPDSEDSFGPDGEPYLTAGTRATVQRGKDREPRSMLVLYTVDESRRVGFAWGHVDEEGAVGEQLFTVEHRTDDTVWAVARGFLSVPNGGLLGLKARNLLKHAIADAKEQLTSLAPGSAATGAVSTVDGPEESAADPGDAEASIEASAETREPEGFEDRERGGDEEREAAAATGADPNEPVTAVIVDLPFADGEEQRESVESTEPEETPAAVEEPAVVEAEPAVSSDETRAVSSDETPVSSGETPASDPHRRRPQRPQGR